MALKIKLFKKRQLWLPTWPTAIAGLVVCVLLAGWLFFASHDFLAVSKPAPGAKVLVVEAWVADNSMEEIAAMLNAGDSPYQSVWLTGPVFLNGSYAYEKFKTYSEMGAVTLEALGVASEKIRVVPAEKHQRHRTHGAAMLLRDEFSKAGGVPDAFDLATVDVHARRSRAVYRKVFGDDAQVGVIALPPPDFEPEDWYKTSPGVKSTFFEIIALSYEVLGDSGR